MISLAHAYPFVAAQSIANKNKAGAGTRKARLNPASAEIR